MGHTGGGGYTRQRGGCTRWVSRANYARHVITCWRVDGVGFGGWDVGGAIRRRRQARMVTCGKCGREMRAGNLARHQRGGGACRVWDPGGGGGGGGQTPDGVDGLLDGWTSFNK